MTDLPALLPPTIEDFEPVPRRRMRRGGWSAARQRQFIEALAETGSVRAACRRLGVAEHGVYALRRHPDAAGFRAAWEAALDLGVQRLEDIAMDRALNGVEEPVYSYGELVGTRIVHNDRLLMFLLRNRAPDRFADGKARAFSAVDAAELKRLKAQWRQEWDHEAALRTHAEALEADEGMAEYLAGLHRQWFTSLGPQARAAYRAFREVEDRERTARPARPQPAKPATDTPSTHLRWQDCAADGDADRPENDRPKNDRDSAEADYAAWFTDDRRARIWWVVEMVFGG